MALALAVGVTVEVKLNGVRVPLVLDDRRDRRRLPRAQGSPSPLLTIPEAAELLRCSRQRIDDLLSQRRLTRVKDGRRTLVRRDEIECYLGC